MAPVAVEAVLDVAEVDLDVVAVAVAVVVVQQEAEVQADHDLDQVLDSGPVHAVEVLCQGVAVVARPEAEVGQVRFAL